MAADIFGPESHLARKLGEYVATCPTSPFQLDATLTDFFSRYDMPAPAPRLLQICTGNFPGRRPQSSPRHATTSTGCQRQTRLWRASTPLLSTQHDEMPWRRVCRCAGVSLRPGSGPLTQRANLLPPLHICYGIVVEHWL